MALANIITYEDFTGILFLDIAGTSTIALAKQAELNTIITEYQQKIFRELFGEALYQYLTDNEDEDVYTVLRDGEIVTIDGYKYEWVGLKKMLASFVYFYFKREKQSFDSDTGEKKSETENSVSSLGNLRVKMIRAWNKGVDYYKDAIDYMDYKNGLSTDYYPELLTDCTNYGQYLSLE